MDDNSETSPVRQFDPMVFELLHPIGSLSAANRGKLVEKARHIRLAAGRSVGAKDWSWSLLYLLGGSLERAVPGGEAEILAPGHPGTDQPIFSHNGSRQAYVTAAEPSEIVAFDRRLFELLQEQQQQVEEADIFEIEGIESTLFQQFTSDFHRGRLQIPGVPEVAERVQRLAERSDISLSELTRLAEFDPALAARVVQAAGGGLDHGGIAAAVGSLGWEKVRKIILEYTSEAGCRKHTPLMRELLLKAHRHSAQVAAYSYVLAQAVRGLNPHHALLCGLLHDVGMFPLLCAADEHSNKIGGADELKAMVWKLHGMISGLVLGSWGFGNDFVVMAEEADDWHRDTAVTAADYTDVVLVAQLHSFVGTERVSGLPQFANLPAFRKIAGDEAGPRFSLWLLQKTTPRLVEIERMLKGIG